jgi:hypothetical protein
MDFSGSWSCFNYDEFFSRSDFRSLKSFIHPEGKFGVMISEIKSSSDNGRESRFMYGKQEFLFIILLIHIFTDNPSGFAVFFR